MGWWLHALSGELIASLFIRFKLHNNINAYLTYFFQILVITGCKAQFTFKLVSKKTYPFP